MNELLPSISGSLDEVVNSIAFIHPELALTLAFLLVILLDLFFGRKIPYVALAVTLLGLAAAAWLTFTSHAALPAHPVFNGMIWPTATGSSFKLIFYIAAALFAVFAALSRETSGSEKRNGDLYTILLGIAIGMNLMAMASNLLMIYISVEMVSIGSYLLVGYLSSNSRQSEAAIKYALFGATSSAVMLYGMSLLYAFTGTLNLFDPAFMAALSQLSPLTLGIALTMMLTGIGFKLSAVPMHIWSPDVYEGAPTPVTAFLSTGPKLAGFALLVLFLRAFPPGDARGLFGFYPLLAVISIATMIAGNFAAIWQDNIKRMLAYSSIGHTGFMLMAIAAGQPADHALLYYGLIYTLTTIGMFLLADHLEEQTGTLVIGEYGGFGKFFPLAMVSMVVLLVSLTGIPPTAGFFGKLLIFSAVWDGLQGEGQIYARLMLITGAITTVVSLFYYFKIPLNAWLRPAGGPIRNSVPAGPKVYIAGVLMVLVVLLGIFPGIAGL